MDLNFKNKVRSDVRKNHADPTASGSEERKNHADPTAAGSEVRKNHADLPASGSATLVNAFALQFRKQLL